MWGRGREGAMVPAPLSTGPQSFTPLPTIKLGPPGAGSRVGGLVHALGPYGSVQWPLLWGWESLLLPPQPPRAFSIRGLTLYFPTLEPWVTQSASLSAVCPVYLCMNVGPQGLPVVRLPALFVPHSASVGPARATRVLSAPAAPLHPSYWSGGKFIFLFPRCRTSLPFDFLSALVVWGGAACLPTPPSWFSRKDLSKTLQDLSGIGWISMFKFFPRKPNLFFWFLLGKVQSHSKLLGLFPMSKQGFWMFFHFSDIYLQTVSWSHLRVVWQTDSCHPINPETTQVKTIFPNLPCTVVWPLD